MKRTILCLVIVFLIGMIWVFVNTRIPKNDSEYSVTVGSQSIPFSDYPDGAYFTDNGLACNDHITCHAGASLYEESACNCKCTWGDIALNSTSCYGFANMVFYRLFGHTTYSQTSKVISDVPVSEINSSYLYDLFTNGTVKAGAHIRTHSHSMIFMGCDTSYIYTYEGNYNSHCKVGVIRRTWSQMTNYFKRKKGIEFIQMPNSYPDEYSLQK